MDNNNLKFQFNATGGAFLVLLLKNVFLTIITLGIYSFWAGVNITKFYYENTTFYEGSFGYHATGKERFFAFLKGLLVIAGLIIAAGILQFLLKFIIGQSASFILIVIAFYAGLILVMPILKVGTLRYHLSRTSWKEFRFRFTGQPAAIFPIYIKGFLLSIVTLGIYTPWFISDLTSFIFENSKIGDSKFGYDGTGKELFFKLLKGMLLTIVTFGLYLSWFTAEMERYTWEHTTFQGKRFKSDLNGGDVFVNLLTNTLLILVTLGIGFSWAIIRTQKLFIEKTSITEEPELSEISHISDSEANADTEGFEGALAFLNTISDMLG